MDVADSQECGDVGFVGLGRQGVAQEDDAVDTVLGHLGADLGVAAEGAGELSLDVEAGFLGDALAGRAGSHEFERREQRLVVLDEVDDFGLLLVVSDEGDAGHARSHRSLAVSSCDRRIWDWR